MGLDEVIAEREDVLDVRASEAVDAVVDQEATRHEVVRGLDVEIDHGTVDLDALHALDDVVPTVLGEHRHPGPDRGSVDERQSVHPSWLVTAEPTDAAKIHVDVSLDAARHRHRVSE